MHPSGEAAPRALRSGVRGPASRRPPGPPRPAVGFRARPRRHTPDPAKARWIVAFALLALAIPLHAETADPAGLLRAIRGARLDPDRAVRVEQVDVDLGPARLRIEHGTLVPARPIEDRTLELVFVGAARFHVEPPDAIEAGQVELFTGRPELDTPVSEAVLVLADPAQIARLLEPPAGPGVPQDEEERAESVFGRWIGSVERASAGAESGMFKAAIGDGAYRDFFALWCAASEIGEFVYAYDPQDPEQLTVAAYQRVDLRGWERIRVAHDLRQQQRKGRFLGLRVEDLGAWDVWMSTDRTAGLDRVGGTGFEAHHYRIDATVLRRSLRLQGRAVVELEATESDRRAVSLELFRDIAVGRVFDGEGHELFAFRSGPEIVVCLPRPSRAGEPLTLDVSFEGQALEHVGSGAWDLRSTSSWYPHAGTVDRATYDVTLRWPRKYTLLTGGTRIDGGEQGHYRWERRRLELPAIAASFVIGKFEVAEHRTGHVRLRLGYHRSSGLRSAAARERTFDVLSRSLGFFEKIFGDYPLDELTVVILPRDYSQSFLGFVTLTDTVARTALTDPRSAGGWIRETTVAHEIAHQWWGNLIGWAGYRDQWLSEAMANYAGLLFHASSNPDVTLAELSAGWRATLTRKVPSGRTIESLGPVVLGSRLNSSLASNGYGAIVYRKGAVVLAMLARAIGEERFLGMLRELVRGASGEVITTESFLSEMERMSGLALDGFARQYVFGTGIPLVYYDYAVRPSEGGKSWVLAGRARRLLEPHVYSRLERRVDGSWDVVRDTADLGDDAGTALIVPFRIALAETETETGDAYRGRRRASSSGQLRIVGSSQSFEITTESRPIAIELDPEGEILADFYSRDASPKRCARYLGLDLMAVGRVTEAERELQRALTEPVGSPDGEPRLPWMRDPERARQLEDLAIRLTLARLYLDQGKDNEAEDQLARADELCGKSDAPLRMERDTLWARLELRRGDYAQAYRRLKQALRVAAPRREPRDWEAREARLRLRSEIQAFTDAYALFAVAAFETGNVDEYEWALAGATERGVDTSSWRAECCGTGPDAPGPRADRGSIGGAEHLAPSR